MRNLTVACVGILLWIAIGCGSHATTSPSSGAGVTVRDSTAVLQHVDLSDPAQPQISSEPISLSAARNETVCFQVQLSGIDPEHNALRISTPRMQSGEPALQPTGFAAYRVVSMPVDLDRAAYVRQTGSSTALSSLPRALVPLKIGADGTVALQSLPNEPSSPNRAAQTNGEHPLTFWFDIHVPPAQSAGNYAGAIDLLRAGSGELVRSLPLQLTVVDFNLPNQRHLQMVGRLDWGRLEKLYPDRFETFTPTWLNRREPRYAQTIKTLDELMTLAQAHRMGLVIPALRPVTKWPAGAGPQLDWRDFDSLIEPWMSGQAFADRVGLGFWPVPAAEMLDRYDRKSQLDYWSQAIAHFDQKQWLDASAVALERTLPGVASPAERLEISTEAAEILSVNPRIKVRIPLQDEQLEFVSAQNSKLIDLAQTRRLMTVDPGQISAPAARAWPQGAARPQHWLRTDTSSEGPEIGNAAREHDVRVWAWLAFLRHVSSFGTGGPSDDNSFVFWEHVLPEASNPARPADPDEMVWFYPGSWFGVDEPVPSIQLKWLRRAEQDYEYLLLARQRGEVINALQMARLISKPVELSPGQRPDPLYALMSGTGDARVWDDCRKLLAETILLRKSDEAPDSAKQQDLYLRTMQWAAPQERPLLINRTADWSWSDAPDGRAAGKWVDLKLGLDIYNASETTPDQNLLSWTQVPLGWEVHPQQQEIPRLPTYHIVRATLNQRFNLDRLTPEARQPMELQFVDGFRKIASPLKLVLPVAVGDRREGRLSIDGVFDDWSTEDEIQNGPMVRMFNAPAIGRQQLELASTPTRLYTAWAMENFYVAFALQGVAPDTKQASRNYVDYQQRRAWGEDLCEILIQPIFADNRTGPVLHVVCKPSGAVAVEQRSERREAQSLWLPMDGTAVRYASVSPGGNWRGEIAIPWRLILGSRGDAPTLLRFNFVQHRAATGESASWAGPVDFGRDDAFMGLIYLRSWDQRGINNMVEGNP